MASLQRLKAEGFRLWCEEMYDAVPMTEPDWLTSRASSTGHLPTN